MPVSQELSGGKVAKGLVGADMVVGVLPLAQEMAGLAYRTGYVDAVVELLGVSSVGPLHVAIELGASRR